MREILFFGMITHSNIKRWQASELGAIESDFGLRCKPWCSWSCCVTCPSSGLLGLEACFWLVGEDCRLKLLFGDESLEPRSLLFIVTIAVLEPSSTTLRFTAALPAAHMSSQIHLYCLQALVTREECSPSWLVLISNQRAIQRANVIAKNSSFILWVWYVHSNVAT